MGREAASSPRSRICVRAVSEAAREEMPMRTRTAPATRPSQEKTASVLDGWDRVVTVDRGVPLAKASSVRGA